MTSGERVCAVIVTHDRAGLLARCLEGLAAQTYWPSQVVVVDNASSDTTAELLASWSALPLCVLRSEVNLGGAGGFRLGVERGMTTSADRLWLMDDDVVPAPSCLEVLVSHPGPALAAVREDRRGALVEKAATHFDLRNPFVPRPKRHSVESTYRRRDAMPEEVRLDNVSFEGFLVRRSVVEDVGLPDGDMFIFYDDVDWALRMRRRGYPVVALRDAVVVRQLDFDQQHDMRSWKGFYMYRNLFLVHFRHGENALVRAKPYLMTVVLLALSPWSGGRAQARNVARALASARRMRRPHRAGAGQGGRTPAR